jgi:hypothetical protein
MQGDHVMDGQEDYRLSFTTGGGLLLQESVQVATLYRDTGDWDAAIHRARQDNLTQARTARSGQRILSEVTARLMMLTNAELELFLKAPRSEQLQLLWLALCKRYQILREFAEEVVRNHFLELELTITRVDFDRFLDRKSVWYTEIDQISETTKVKLSQVALQILREAEIISPESIIQPALLSSDLIEVVVADSPALLRIFPVSEADVRRAKR